MQVLLDHGADINHPNTAGNGHSTVTGCLANGRGEAAVFLAARGARLDIEGAAGVGRLDVVQSFFDPNSQPRTGVSKARIESALRYACGWGRTDVVAFLLDHGADAAAHDDDGQTSLHRAAIGGHLEIIKLLLTRNAPLETHNRYGGTVLGQAAWSAAHGGDPAVYVPIVEALIAAGAKVPERHPPVNQEVDAVLARHGSVSDDSLAWFGE